MFVGTAWFAWHLHVALLLIVVQSGGSEINESQRMHDDCIKEVCAVVRVYTVDETSIF